MNFKNPVLSLFGEKAQGNPVTCDESDSLRKTPLLRMRELSHGKLTPQGNLLVRKLAHHRGLLDDVLGNSNVHGVQRGVSCVE